MASRLYFVGNRELKTEFKTVTAMRYELAKATGDNSYLDIVAVTDALILDKYAEVSGGWVEEVQF